MEQVAISETVLPTQEKKDEVKKIEFNVNAKEFVPILSQEIPLEESETWNPDQHNPKPVINKKMGENYKPVFMDGMTEKFIEGPYVGNGKDPELPFVRYYSKGQAIDFFNKKYFSADPSGEILYRPSEGGAQPGAGAEEYLQQKPFLDSVIFQRNIFRPPIIDLMVQDLLYRQYLGSARPKTVQAGRRGGKTQFVSYSRGGLGRGDSKKDASTEPLSAGSQEVWLEAEECAGKEVPEATSTPVDSVVNSEKCEEPETAKSEPPEQKEKQIDSPKEQRQTKVRGKGFTNSKLSSPDKFKLKNGQKKTDMNINDKTSKAELEEKLPNSDEDQQSNKCVIAETKESPVVAESACCINFQEDDIKSMENLSIEVNITIDAPSKDYPMKEEAKAIEPLSH